MGYNYDEFLDLTPRSLSNGMEGFNEKQEAHQRDSWEVMRTQTTTMVNLQVDKGKRLKPKDLFTFPWDQKKVVKKLSKEEAKAILNKWQKH